MKKDISEYVSKCLMCQQVKAKHQVPSSLLNPLPIPQLKWDNITMDFVSGFPLTQRKHDAVWVIVDKLTKSAHFLPVRLDYSMDRLAELCQIAWDSLIDSVRPRSTVYVKVMEGIIVSFWYKTEFWHCFPFTNRWIV